LARGAIHQRDAAIAGQADYARSDTRQNSFREAAAFVDLLTRFQQRVALRP
jgi:hypothetical protein